MLTATRDCAYVLVCPALDDLGDDDQSVFEVLGDEVEAGERAQELAAEYGSCAVVRRPAEIVLVTGDARPVDRHHSNGYTCPWCGCGVRDREARAGCPNPQCLASQHWSAAEVAAELERREEVAETLRESLRRAEFGRQYVEEQRQERERLWGEVTAEAARRGACLECLGQSGWRFGRPKYVRHRRADYHDRES